MTRASATGGRGPESTIAKGPGTTPATGHNTYDDTGSVTTFAMPGYAGLGHYTHQVFVDSNWEHLLASRQVPAAGAAPAAIPARLGQPSPIKHVFLIVKQNRTYDQVLGDIGKQRPVPGSVRREGHAQPARPGQHVRAVRQLLRRQVRSRRLGKDSGSRRDDGHLPEMGRVEQASAFRRGRARRGCGEPGHAQPARLVLATGWVRPYPGDKKILAPDQVPGRNLPADYIGG